MNEKKITKQMFARCDISSTSTLHIYTLIEKYTSISDGITEFSGHAKYERKHGLGTLNFLARLMMLFSPLRIARVRYAFFLRLPDVCQSPFFRSDVREVTDLNVAVFGKCGA